MENSDKILISNEIKRNVTIFYNRNINFFHSIYKDAINLNILQFLFAVFLLITLSQMLPDMILCVLTFLPICMYIFYLFITVADMILMIMKFVLDIYVERLYNYLKQKIDILLKK